MLPDINYYLSSHQRQPDFHSYMYICFSFMMKYILYRNISHSLTLNYLYAIRGQFIVHYIYAITTQYSVTDHELYFIIKL